jgi:uncharacterized protein YcaQ
MKISRPTARRLVLAALGLDGRWGVPRGKEGVAQTVERLAAVQIDTIAVVQRAHHHTLWTRRPDYRPAMLDELLDTDRRVFEYWAPAASYVPMCDYRYYIPAMQRAAKHHWHVGTTLQRHGELVEHVLARIRREGALASADFAAPDGRKRGPWWDWKPAKLALEAHFAMGTLMVTRRRNFQRVYDLPERVLPAGLDTSPPTPDELARFRVRRELGAQGLCELKGWWIGNRQRIDAALAELTDAGEVVRVELDGEAGGEPFFALRERLDEAAKPRRGRRQVHLLSPFDNLIMRRPHRLRRLFAFETKLECYAPAGKRRFGYFCLPILFGDRFVGRLDPKADRERRVLCVHALHFEPDFGRFDALLGPLAAKLVAFAAFNECDRVRIEKARPAKLLSPLRKALAAR